MGILFVSNAEKMSRLCTVLVLAACLVASAAAADFVIENASRRINLKNTWAKAIDTLKAKNTAGSDLSNFVVCYPGSLAPRIAVLKVLIKKEKQDVAVLEQAPQGAPSGVSCYQATFKSPVQKDAIVEFDVVATVTGVFRPNPASIGQGDKQYVEYYDNLYLLSPYEVTEQSSTVLLPTSDVKSYSPEDGASKSGSKVSYAKLGRQAPWAVQELQVHFQHDKPFKRINSLVREIEVSHWGNIYVEETYEIQNAGAQHTGKFSRMLYAHSQEGKGNSFPDVRAHLPAAAHSLYYKDIIGNISSSDTTHTSKETAIEVRLRYPLMGGWKTDFTLGYSVPLEGFLYRRPKGKLRLLMELSTSFNDVWVEQLTTRVVLPEGAKHIKATLPYPDIQQSWDKKFTYLDTAGRPVLVLTKANVVPEQNKHFAVDYSFTFTGMMREPLLLISVFAAFFAAVALYSRLDFTITRDEKWLEAQAHDKALGIIQQLTGYWDSEADVLDRLVKLAHSVSNRPLADAAPANRQALESELRPLDEQSKVLLSQVEALSPKLAAAARSHADKGKVLLVRAAKLLSDKSELIRKDVAAHEASTRLAAATLQLEEAIREWVDEGAKMAQG
ncbi:Ribophorin I-domain-containing protein [Scenedesmus sp. NREL 46B-D3]|nr:Ribophorin I-domain-containing protein [Scenedesmus sp. NREL 46B-D3]